MTLLNLAIRARRCGFKVLPLREDKKPYTEHGYKDASANKKLIAYWWRMWPNALVGMVPGSGGWVVIDLDCKNGARGLENWTELTGGTDWADGPNVVWTQSGGAHIYYALPPGVKVGCSTGMLPSGIDVRGSTGYVVLYTWPSDVPTAPQWLLDKLLPPRIKRQVPTPRASGIPTRTGAPVVNFEQAFRDRGKYRDDIGGGKHAVECPWSDGHSGPGGFTSTIIAEPGVWDDGDLWRFKCSHTSCNGRSGKDVYALWFGRQQ